MSKPKLPIPIICGTRPIVACGVLPDGDKLVFAHKDENLLPAHLSEGLETIVAGAVAKYQPKT